MKNSFAKETARSITHSLGRFVAIAAIVALGTGFYAGLRMTAPDMKQAADEYFDGTGLMDIRVVSTLGLTDDDISALRHVDGVDAVMPAYEADATVTMGDEQYATRIHSLPASAASSDTSDGIHAVTDDEDYLNRPILTDGRWPEAAGECVLSSDLVVSRAAQIGDEITLTEGSPDLDTAFKERAFTVVGFVSAPYYATSSSLGTTTLGTGTIQQYLYIGEDDFADDFPYTEAFVTVRGAAELNGSSQSYDDRVQEVLDRIEAMAPEREQLRAEGLRADAQRLVDEARAEYEKQKADAEQQLADAQKKLDDAAATIEASEQQIADGQKQHDDGVLQLAQQKNDAYRQLDASQRQIDDGYAQLADGKAQLDAAAAQLADARAQWQQGTDQLAAAKAQLDSQETALEDGIKAAQDGVAQYDDGIAAAQKTIDELKQKIDKLETDIAELEGDLEKKSEEITAAEGKQKETEEGLAAAQKAESDAKAYIEDAPKKKDQIDKDLEEKKALLDKKEITQEEYDQAVEDAKKAKEDIDKQVDEHKENLPVLAESVKKATDSVEAAKKNVADITAARDKAQKSLEDDKADLKKAQEDLKEESSRHDKLESDRKALQGKLDDLVAQRPAIAQGRADIAATQQQLDAAKAQADAGQATYDQNLAAYNAQAAQLDKSAADVAAARQQADDRFAAAQQQLDDAAAQMRDARVQVEQGKEDLRTGTLELEEQRADADKQLADGKRQLDDAQAEVDAIEAPDWLVMDRDANYGAASFEADANRVDSIAQVFPLIFFLVAALVALTTMTRMVDEERVLVGTYKALGYSRARIASKFLIYAGLASGIGSIIGIAVLSQALPTIIMHAYGVIYFVPVPPLPIAIHWPLALLSFGLGVGITLAATGGAAWATLRERPAALMQPRAPKAGRRILLERITPLWRHLSFSWKVTFRNLFRYKRRLFMTVIGIAGCTALLLTGLGLSNSINDIIDRQFGQIERFNASISIDDEATDEQRADLDRVLSGAAVSDHMPTLRDNLLAAGPDASDEPLELIVPADPSRFGDFFVLRDRASQQPVQLADDGLVLTEKLAATLGVRVGDKVTFTEQDAIGNPTGTSYAAEVTGIVENYVYHYAFMGPQLYERLKGAEPAFDAELAIVSTDGPVRDSFSEQARDTGAAKTVAYNDETIDSYRSMLKSVNMVVVVLVVAAAALAFIVLVNLININITERVREIATLKVLGFTPREMNAYIFREVFLLAIIGCVVGLGLGVLLEGYVVVSAEVDQVMFGRTIHAASYVIAFVLTMVFTALVMFAMRHKLQRIDMVESLKSNE